MFLFKKNPVVPLCPLGPFEALVDARSIPTRDDAVGLLDVDMTLILLEPREYTNYNVKIPPAAILEYTEKHGLERYAINIPLLNSLLSYGIKRICLFTNMHKNIVHERQALIRRLQAFGFEITEADVITPMDYFFKLELDPSADFKELREEFLKEVSNFYHNSQDVVTPEIIKRFNDLLGAEKYRKIHDAVVNCLKNGRAGDGFVFAASPDCHLSFVDSEFNSLIKRLHYGLEYKGLMYLGAAARFPEVNNFVVVDDNGLMLQDITRANLLLGSEHPELLWMPECGKRNLICMLAVEKRPNVYQSYDGFLDEGRLVKAPNIRKLDLNVFPIPEPMPTAVGITQKSTTTAPSCTSSKKPAAESTSVATEPTATVCTVPGATKEQDDFNRMFKEKTTILSSDKSSASVYLRNQIKILLELVSDLKKQTNGLVEKDTSEAIGRVWNRLGKFVSSPKFATDSNFSDFFQMILGAQGSLANMRFKFNSEFNSKICCLKKEEEEARQLMTDTYKFADQLMKIAEPVCAHHEKQNLDDDQVQTKDSSTSRMPSCT